MKVAIITGGAGFIGSHMVEFLLKKNFFIFAIDNLSNGKIKNLNDVLENPNFKFLNLDIKKKISKNIFKKKVDYIYHFAGIGDVVPSIEKPIEYLNNNFIGTSQILELARELRIKKLIYAASSSCYGINNKKISEKDGINLEHPYALSKFYAEKLCFFWAKLYKINVVSIRIFNAYGPRVRTNNNYGAVFGVFFKQKLENKPLTVVGNGKQKRDYIYVTDVCNAFYLASQKKKADNQIFNLGTGKPQEINKLVKILNSKIIKIPWRPGEPRVTWANINKIKKYLNWKPKITFDYGVKKMLIDINYWKNAPLWNKKKIEKATKNWFKILDEKK
jgi:UDP-glucose 4-epimerase